MDQPTPDQTVAGVKLATLLFAFLGSAVSLSYAKEMTRVQMISAVVTGMAVSVSLSPLILHYLALNDSFERAISFFAALGAMRIIPIFFSWIDRLRGMKIPGVPDSKE